MTTTTLTSGRARTHSTYKNVALWTFQGWIAMFFIAAGYAKLTEPMTNLIALMGWPAVAPDNMVRGVGVVELVLGLAVLTPLIAMEATMLMVHALSHDIGLAVVNLLLLAITVPVLLGRRKA